MDHESAETSPEPASDGVPQPLAYAMPHEPGSDFDRLTRGDVACLALRIIGLYVIVQALPLLVTFIDYFRADFQHILATGMPFVLVAGLGVALLALSTKLAKWMLPRTAVVASELPGHAPAQFQAIAFSIVGVFLVASSVPWVVYLLTRLIAGDTRPGTSAATPLTRIEGSLPSLLHYGVEMGLGVWLFFGSKRLAAWWWQMRHPELRYIEGEEAIEKKESSNPPSPAE